MTGLEMLKEKLKEQGIKGSQLENKIIPIILSIIAENPQIKEYNDYQKEIEKLKKEIEYCERIIQQTKHTCDYWIDKQDKAFEKTKEIENILSAKEYYEKAEQAKAEMLICETAEARDSMRKAIFYINTVKHNGIISAEAEKRIGMILTNYNFKEEGKNAETK